MPATLRQALNIPRALRPAGMPDVTIDATGLYCPEPVFRAKVEMEKMQPGQVLEVRADDPVAEDDITGWAGRSGHEVLGVERDGKAVTITLKRR